MKITSIKVTLELEGGEEVVLALQQLFGQCAWREAMTNASLQQVAEQHVTSEDPVAPAADDQTDSADAIDESMPSSKEDRLQWAAGKVRDIVANAVRGCKDYDTMLDRCNQYHIMWMFKALLGIPASESEKSAVEAMMALDMPESARKHVLRLMGVMKRAKY